MELQAMTVFISEADADLMRKAPVWMMEGTFFTIPKSYY
jgi:hypothetical protein